MVDRTRADATHGGWVVPFAQARLDDEVVAAGLFRPNAPGRGMWSSLEAFGQRQILKAAGRHHGERIVLALTALHLHGLALSPTGRVVERLRWSRDGIRVSEVPRRAGAVGQGPALVVGPRDGPPTIEVVEDLGSAMCDRLVSGIGSMSGTHR
jgi:hypothetical protein